MPRLMLSDDQYKRIRPLLPEKDPDSAEQQQILDGFYHLISDSGTMCITALPDGLKQKIGHSVFAEFASDADFEEIFVDSTIVLGSSACGRSFQKNGDPSIGRSRGELTTKTHALVDGLGMLARFSLTGG